jgi:phosphoglycolate phosphatase
MNDLVTKEIKAGFPQLWERSRHDHRNAFRKAGYKLAVFDFDGTLADSISWFLRVINEVADTCRFRRIKEEELPRLRTYDARKIIEHVGVPMWKVPLIQRHLQKRMTRDVGKIRLFAGIDGLLQRLHAQGVDLAIVSSNSAVNVREILGRQNASLIQYYACGAQILGKRVKLRKVLQRSGVLHSEAIFIGDEIRDLHAAHAEGVAFGAVSWGVNSPESLKMHCPKEIFSSVDEIAERVTPPAFAEASFPVRVAWF